MLLNVQASYSTPKPAVGVPASTAPQLVLYLSTVYKKERYESLVYKNFTKSMEKTKLGKAPVLYVLGNFLALHSSG